MATVLFGGFEMGTYNGEFSGLAAPVIVPTSTISPPTVVAGGRSGSYEIRTNAYSSEFAAAYCWALNFPSALSEFYFQIAMKSANLAVWDSGAWKFLAWRNGSTYLGGLRYNPTGNVMEVYTGNFATLVGTFPAPPGGSLYWVFEIHLVIADAGTIEIRKDMVSVFTFSGDTKPGTETTVDNFFFGNAKNTYWYCDDFVLNDATWPGGARVSCVAPTADDGVNQWTPSTGTDHRALVDEVPPSATDFLSTTTVDQVERFGLADLPAAAATIFAVKAIAQARKDSDVAPDKLALGLNIGGSDYYASGQVLSISSQPVVQQWLTSPATAGAFTPAEVNGMKLSMKSAA